MSRKEAIAWVLVVVLWLLAASVAIWGQEPTANSPARYAVVRVISHGGSATVIHSSPGRTYLLSAGHMFQGRDRSKPIKINAPTPTSGNPVRANPRVVDVELSQDDDIALISMDVGPLPYIAPVAPVAYIASPNCLSVGYDRMELPQKVKRATIIKTTPKTAFTQELPWHGRSGGALIDDSAGYLVGVVSAYTSQRGPRRDGGSLDRIPGEVGIYASHRAVVAFLRKNGLEPNGTGLTQVGQQRFLDQKPRFDYPQLPMSGFPSKPYSPT